MKTSMVDRLRSGEFLVGTWAKIPSIETVELIGHVGFDFAVIDMEHAPHSFQSAYSAIAHAQASGMSALIRAPDRSGSAIQRILDAGADGILVPRVETPEQAIEATASMAFPPMGHRGMGYTSRAARWGLDTAAEYLARGRDHVLRAVQLEDMGSLENIDAILEAPALNGVFIGFGDLALSSGLPGSHPTLRALETKVLAAANARGIPCGTAVQTPDEAARCKQVGYSYCMISADTSLFAKAAKALITDTRAALA